MTGKPEKSYSALNVILLVCIVLLLLVIGILLYKINLSGPPGPPPLPGPPPAAVPPVSEKLKVTKGKVVGYVNNVHLDINGIKLQTSGQGELTFEFRPHTARAVLSVAQPGDEVEIQYNSQPNDEAVTYQLHHIKNLRTSKETGVDELPMPPRIPQGEPSTLFQIDKPAIVTDGYGGVAALQAPGKLFHFKPEQVEDIQGLIKNGYHFKLLAVKREDEQGFVNIHHDAVYIVISITIDNKTFMIR